MNMYITSEDQFEIIPLVKQQIEEQVKKFLNIASKKHEINFVTPSISYNITKGIGGTTYFTWSEMRKGLRWKILYTMTEINLNPILLLQEFDLIMDVVIPHEVAHQVTWDLECHKRKGFLQFNLSEPHCSKWKKVMIDTFSLQPDVSIILPINLT